jgi:hypothetical protein
MTCQGFSDIITFQTHMCQCNLILLFNHFCCHFVAVFFVITYLRQGRPVTSGGGGQIMPTTVLQAPGFSDLATALQGKHSRPYALLIFIGILPIVGIYL